MLLKLEGGLVSVQVAFLENEDACASSCQDISASVESISSRDRLVLAKEDTLDIRQLLKILVEV